MGRRSLKVALQHINRVKLAYQCRGYSQQALAREVGLARSTVSKFLNGESVDRLNFVELCEKLGQDWQEIAHKEVDTASQTPPTPSHPFQPNTYKSETWVEREQPLADATKHLRENCRILLIAGITGQGKTALAERVAETLQQEWQPLLGVNLDDETARNFEVAAERLLVQMGETVQAEDRKQPQFLLNRLVKRLQENSYLVPIDSLEVLLEGKTDFTVDHEFREEHRDWWQFCQRLLLSPACQSRLILTSQDLPTQFESDKSRFWHRLPLSGLNETEQMQLFAKLLEKQLPEISPEAREYLKRMGKAYEGHPLVIEVIAGEIATDFAGDVVGYWRRYHREFEEIEATPGNQQLQRRVKARVRQSLERLRHDSESAFGLLLAASVYRRKVPESFWLVMVEGEDGYNLLEMLKLRGLIIHEYNLQLREVFLRQHNLIRNTAGEWLHKKMRELWQAAHRKAATVWLNHYQPEPDAENLEKVRGYLEAFHHYCQVEDWEAAKDILIMQVDSPTQVQLHNQLSTWGYYSQQIDLWGQLVGKLGNLWDGICLYSIGNAYQFLGQYRQALKNHERSLNYFIIINNFQCQKLVLRQLGITYCFLGDYEKSTQHHKRLLNFNIETRNKLSETYDRVNLALVDQSRGQHFKALSSYKPCLKIIQEFGDRKMEMILLTNMGCAYDVIGEYKTAIHCHHRSIQIARDLEDRAGEGTALGHLGLVYYSLGEYERAIDFLQQRLDIAREISDRDGEGSALANLGNAYESLGDYQRAIEFHQQHLVIAREIGSRSGEGGALGNLGVAYQSLGKYLKALDFHQQHLDIAREIGNYEGEGDALANLGDTQFKLERYPEALENTQRALELFETIGYRSKAAHRLKNLAEIYEILGNIDTALECCDRALNIATELGIPLAQTCQELKERLLNQTS